MNSLDFPRGFTRIEETNDLKIDEEQKTAIGNGGISAHVCKLKSYFYLKYTSHTRMEPSHLKVLIKNPYLPNYIHSTEVPLGNYSSLSLDVHLFVFNKLFSLISFIEWTVVQLKEKFSSEYPGNPDGESQRILYQVIFEQELIWIRFNQH